MDEESRMDKTPFNIKADYKEVEHHFRNRLDSLLPPHLAERIHKVLSKRLNPNSEGEDSKFSGE